MRGCGHILIAIAGVCSCGGPRHGAHVPASDAQRGWYAIHFASAVVMDRRPEGTPWHVKPPDRTALVVGGLVGLALGNPQLGVSIGSALADPGGDPLAPAPYIELKVAGVSHRISATSQTYSPRWTQPIAVDARRFTGSEQVVIQVKDALNDAPITQHELTFSELAGQPTRTFTRLGPVASLDVTVTPLQRSRATYTIVVPADASSSALASGAHAKWHPIPVWNGDTVTVEATGRVCPTRSSTDCFGPAGASGRWESYSYDGFRKVPHASLVAVAPGMQIAIGARRTFRVEQSGRVLLFVNDTDVDNNSGSFEARITVSPPE